MDITNFITWFLNETLNIFTYTFNTLDNIQFMGISLLKLDVAVVVLGALLPVLLTIPVGIRGMTERIPKGREQENYMQYKREMELKAQAKNHIRSIK